MCFASKGQRHPGWLNSPRTDERYLSASAESLEIGLKEGFVCVLGGEGDMEYKDQPLTQIRGSDATRS